MKLSQTLEYIQSKIDGLRFAGTDQNPGGIRDLLGSAVREAKRQEENTAVTVRVDAADAIKALREAAHAPVPPPRPATGAECLAYMAETHHSHIETAACRLYGADSAHLVKHKGLLRVDFGYYGPSLRLEGAHLHAVIRYAMQLDQTQKDRTP